MARRKPKYPDTWSHSRQGVHAKCPFRYKLQYIDKLPQPPNRHAERGNDIHAKGEHYLLGDIRGIPREYGGHAEELRGLKRLCAVPEQMWSVGCAWKTCGWKDYGVTWLRAKCDVHLYFEEERSLSIIDFKTGQVYPTHKGQGELYSVMGLSYYPELLEVNVEFWYLDKGTIANYDYDVKTVKKLKNIWHKRGVNMLKDRKFLATPSDDSCKWCPYHPKKGGPCKKGV